MPAAVVAPPEPMLYHEHARNSRSSSVAVRGIGRETELAPGRPHRHELVAGPNVLDAQVVRSAILLGEYGVVELAARVQLQAHAVPIPCLRLIRPAADASQVIEFRDRIGPPATVVGLGTIALKHRVVDHGLGRYPRILLDGVRASGEDVRGTRVGLDVLVPLNRQKKLVVPAVALVVVEGLVGREQRRQILSVHAPAEPLESIVERVKRLHELHGRAAPPTPANVTPFNSLFGVSTKPEYRIEMKRNTPLVSSSSVPP